MRRSSKKKRDLHSFREIKRDLYRQQKLKREELRMMTIRRRKKELAWLLPFFVWQSHLLCSLASIIYRNRFLIKLN